MKEDRRIKGVYTKEDIMKFKTNIKFGLDPIEYDYNGLNLKPIRVQNTNLSLAEEHDVITNGKERLIFLQSHTQQHIGHIWTTEYILNWINNDPSKYIPFEVLNKNNWHFEF